MNTQEKIPADFLWRGGIVLSMDSARRVYAPGVVVVAGDSLVAVGGPELEAAYAAREVIDCSGQIIMPGLVDTHTHLPMSLLRGLSDDVRLDVWLNGYMMPVEREFVSPDFCHWGTLLACIELIQGGVTCFADMYYFERDVATAAAEAGLRGICGETVLKFPSPDAASYDDSLAWCRRFISQWGSHPLIIPAVAPHAPYTCTPEILREAAALAIEFDVPLLTHIAETELEVNDWKTRFGTTPVRWLEELGLFEAKVVAAHCAYIDEEEMRILLRRNCGVAHNPTSNLKLASGIAPVAGMLAQGLRLGIGTDGTASNNDLDMFEELRLAALLPKGVTGDPTVAPAWQVMEMATINGARALHLEHLVGSLEPGKRADLIVADLSGFHAVPQFRLSENNIYSHLVYSGKACDVRHTMVNGRLLMRDRQILTLDVAEVARKAQEYADRIGAFVSRRERSLVDKLVALGDIEREETYEIQLKARWTDLDAAAARLESLPDVQIIKHTHRQQYDTYLLFSDPMIGRVRYREDTCVTEGTVAGACWTDSAGGEPEYRLTLMGQGNEQSYEDSVILTRSRFDAPARHSLRFYREYFQPSEVRELTKHRLRYRFLYKGLEFALNLDQLLRPERDDNTFLEIKSRTWSSRDALRKADLASDIFQMLGGQDDDLVRGEYVTL